MSPFSGTTFAEHGVGGFQNKFQLQLRSEVSQDGDAAGAKTGQSNQQAADFEVGNCDDGLEERATEQAADENVEEKVIGRTADDKVVTGDETVEEKAVELTCDEKIEEKVVKPTVDEKVEEKVVEPAVDEKG